MEMSVIRRKSVSEDKEKGTLEKEAFPFFYISIPCFGGRPVEK